MTAPGIGAWPTAHPQGLTVSGRNLTELSAIVESFAPTAAVPARRGGNVTVPRRHGDIRVPGKPYTAADFVLSILVRGCQPDGTIPAGSSEREELEARTREILALFSGETTTLVRTLADGTTVTCDVEVTAAVPVARDFSQVPTIARIAVACVNWAAFWFDVDEVASQAVFATSGQVQPLYEFSGATAPMDDLDITIGPAWNPVLTDPVSGSWVAYDGIVGAGQALRLSRTGRRVYGDGGLFVDQALVRRGGVRGRLFELAPGNPPRIVVESSGPDPVSVQVAGRRAFLTA